MNDRTEPRILLAFGGVVLAETIAALLWAGAAAQRLDQLEAELGRMDVVIERTARLEEQNTYIRQSLIRIERKIDDAGEEMR